MAPVVKTHRWYDVFDEGDVVGDGVNDDGPGIQRAIDKATSGAASYGPIGGTVVLPPGRYRSSVNLVAPSTVRIQGSGGYQSIVLPDPGVTGLTIRANSNGQRNVGLSSYDPIASGMGTRLREFGVMGTNGEGQTGVVFEDQTDRVVVDDLKIAHCDIGMVISGNGPAPEGIGLARECEFYSLSIDHCGTATGDPALLVTANERLDGGPTDGTNQLYFYGLRTLYNYGPVMFDDSAATENLRRVQMHGWMLHGRGADNPAGWGDACQILGISDFQAYGLMANGSQPGAALIRMGRGTDNSFPRNVILHGSIGTSQGDGIVVEEAQALDIVMVQAGVVAGDDLRVDAGAMQGNRPAHVKWISSNDGSVANSPTINIDPIQRQHIHGYWDGLQRLDRNVEVIDGGNNPRILTIPGGGGAVTAV